jgi:hypothetical protein
MENNLKGSQSSLFAEVSHASLFPRPGSDKAIKMTVTSGLKCSDLYKRSDPVGLSVKMLLASSAWASTKCFLTWKVKTTPAKRLLFQLVPSMPRTGEIESGLWETPNANEDRAEKYRLDTSYRHKQEGRQIHLAQQVRDERLFPTPKAREPGSTSEGYGDCLNDVVKGRKGWDKLLPTPDANIRGARTNQNGHQVTLQDVVAGKTPEARGFWTTPTAHNAKEGAYPAEFTRKTPTLAAEAIIGSPAKMWPTPTASDAKTHWNDKIRFDSLTAEINKQRDADKMFPTPKASEHKGGYSSKSKTPSLGAMATHNLWPTPNASDNRDRGNLSNPSVQRRLVIGKQLGLSMVVSPTSGQLNPMWVEWLMGFPIGWTDLNS